MKHRILWSSLILLALGLAACGPTSTPLPTLAPTQPPAATKMPAATDTAAPTETPAPTAMPAKNTSMTSQGTAMPGQAMLKMGNSTNISAPYLTNGDGMAVYLYTNDSQNSGKSTCTGGCASIWPPVTTVGKSMAGQGVDASLLGTLTRADGSIQVTYNGWPLYTFAKDTAPSNTNGEGVKNVWYLISAKGDAIKQ